MSKRKPASKSKSSRARGGVPRGTAGKVRPKPPKPVRPPSGEIEIIARGCLIRGSKVLLCQNLKHGYFYLPGGHVEFCESAAAALAREFLEESGLRVRVTDLALVSEGAFATKKHHHHELNLVFHLEHGGGGDAGEWGANAGAHPPVRSLEDGIAFAWVELAAVPETDVRPVSAKAWLAAGAGQTQGTIEWVSEIQP